MKIAVLCPVHRRADLVLEQIKNYTTFGGGDFVHILHPSQEGRESFAGFGDLCSNFADVCVADESWPTSWSCVMGAFLSCTQQLESMSDIGYVYLHTDGDLLFKKGMAQWIKSHETGCKGYRYHSNSAWVHSQSMVMDAQFSELRKHLNIKDDEIFYGRQEGVFFPKDIWVEIVRLVSKFIKLDYFNSTKQLWPLEESIIPTLAKYLLNEFPASGNLIYTKEISQPGGRENPDNCLMVDDIIKFRSDANFHYFGAKWFPQNQDSSSRQLIKTLEMDVAYDAS